MTTTQAKQALTLEEARELARNTWGRLNCDSIHAVPFDVDWGEAFSTESELGTDGMRARVILPDLDGRTLRELFDWLEERGWNDADEWRERAAGLTVEGFERLAELRREFRELDGKALRGPDLGIGAFPRSLTDEELERLREVREEIAELVEERDATREDAEELAEELAEVAADAAQDSAHEWEPAMNYAYPLPGGLGMSDCCAQGTLEGVGSVVVVELDGETVLALHGGGMDFSWEICAAYVALGFRPPLHFADLPRMAGRGESDRDRALMALCIESGEIAARWAGSTVDSVRARFEDGGQS